MIFSKALSVNEQKFEVRYRNKIKILSRSFIIIMPKILFKKNEWRTECHA